MLHGYHCLQVVAFERPDLQKQANDSIVQLSGYAVTLKQLEDDLLSRLAAAQVVQSHDFP